MSNFVVSHLPNYLKLVFVNLDLARRQSFGSKWKPLGGNRVLCLIFIFLKVGWALESFLAEKSWVWARKFLTVGIFLRWLEKERTSNRVLEQLHLIEDGFRFRDNDCRFEKEVAWEIVGTTNHGVKTKLTLPSLMSRATTCTQAIFINSAILAGWFICICQFQAWWVFVLSKRLSQGKSWLTPLLFESRACLPLRLEMMLLPLWHGVLVIIAERVFCCLAKVVDENLLLRNLLLILSWHRLGVRCSCVWWQTAFVLGLLLSHLVLLSCIISERRLRIIWFCRSLVEYWHLVLREHCLNWHFGSLVTSVRSVKFMSREGHSDTRGEDMLLLLDQKVELSLVSARVYLFKPEKVVHGVLIKSSPRAEALTCLTIISLAGSVNTAVQDLVKTVLELALDGAGDPEAVLNCCA